MTNRCWLFTLGFSITAIGSLLLTACGGGSNDGDGAAARPAAGESRTTSTADLLPQEIIYSGPMTRSSVDDNPPDWPPIEFSPAEMHFGVISPGQNIKGTVTIHNAGTRALKVLRSGTSCGCTTAADLSGHVILPGGEVEVPLGMKPKSGLGEKQESFTMFFEGYEQVPVRYYIKGEVSLPIRAYPSPLDIRESLVGEMTVESRESDPFRVLAINGEPPQFIDFNPETDEPRGQYRIAYDMTDAAARREIPWYYVIETDHPDAPIIDVRIWHDQTRVPRYQGRPWVSKDWRVILDVAQPGEPVEVAASIEYAGTRNPQPETADLDILTPELFDAEIIDVEVDDKVMTFRLSITPKQTTPGLLYGQLELMASGFPTPVYVIGRIDG